MIVKIMKPAGSTFPGVNYNDKKIDKGKGELMLMKNFPSFINGSSNKEEVKSYLASVSKNEKVKKPQFHAALSTKFREHSKEELTKVAESFMDEMGYGDQPFIVVFHNDTENNHVHLVSTRVDKSTGKKINDSYEKLKSQKALAKVMEKMYGISNVENINKLLSYRISSLKQLELLLERNGFRLAQNKEDETKMDILKNGVREKTINGNQIVFDNKKNENRTKQIKAILSKYKELHSGTIFKVEDRRKQEAMLPEEKQDEDPEPKIEFESELQKKLKDTFGIDIIFHHKDGQKPFGYSLIDNKTGTVYKGSEIMKMNELFEFTSQTIDKRLFERLKDFNIPDKEIKTVLLNFLKAKHPENELHDFMLFENKKFKNKETFGAIRNDVREYLKTQNNDDVSIIKSEDGKYYAIHSKFHYIGELETLIGEKQFQNFLNPTVKTENKKEDSLEKVIDDFLLDMMKSSAAAKDPAEEELRKRKKRKSR
ncbi:relaxase/mobilization nuclease domain-containing protein [Elizabethkingia sp. M8]|uniref:relaxase/mobilization nuclease domain-containing protein n=1 Tax=Elizabethkingia sp. M8 TaxID=2796140 RepID=UPI00190889E7|nr:relaxase/mobilization nuclease domain-containing protein [Elizabethkingia sp. M8]QQM25883.1 relaxase/mobilization nuclease domain-containing protein [Elizabethkingia sp. M8]